MRVVVAPAPPSLGRRVDGLVVGEVAGQRLGETLGLPQRVGDALCGREVFEVPGIADQDPAGSCGLTEVAVPLGHHPDRAYSSCTGEQVSEFGPAGDARAERRIAVRAEAGTGGDAGHI